MVLGVLNLGRRLRFSTSVEVEVLNEGLFVSFVSELRSTAVLTTHLRLTPLGGRVVDVLVFHGFRCIESGEAVEVFNQC
ncbi:hypothetical protein CA604_04820 [Taylorella equigenitalis]|nr:hypothetical protein CA604_04820 [Taylorella equigenitalis]